MVWYPSPPGQHILIITIVGAILLTALLCQEVLVLVEGILSGGKAERKSNSPDITCYKNVRSLLGILKWAEVEAV